MSNKIITPAELVDIAKETMTRAYAPYSGCLVGAALLCRDGSVFTGCNIENAAFSPTVCAERVAFFGAISHGIREFNSIAVAGGREGKLTSYPPCGVCRQVMCEFCDPDNFLIYVADNIGFNVYKLSDLLPHAFGSDSVL